MLRLAARQGRLLLVLGLVIAIASPMAAAWVRPWLPLLITALLGLAAFRIGGRLSLGSGPAVARAAGLVVVYQVLAPLLVLGAAWSVGLAGALPVAALVLMLAAPSLTGAPNFTVLLGHDPAMALRMLLVGTAILPFAAVPLLSLLPELGGPEAVRIAALRLALVIGGTVALAFAARSLVGEARAMAWQTQIDGASAILLAVLVIGLMVAVGPALRETPIALLGWLAFACAANFGLQILGWTSLAALPEAERAGAAFIAGNRNIALFLVALPASATDPLLLFIGCYQVPMYLTPVLMRWLYRS